MKVPKFVYSREGEERGKVTGGESLCMMAGCGGARISVRWPDGKLTKPCSKDMITRKDGDWQLRPYS